MVRIVLCGRRNEDPGYLLKALIDFSPGCDGVYCIKYQHGSTFLWSWLWSNLHLYDINLHCISGSYVQVWVLYHMDLRCILVAMLVYLSHGSTLYWSAAMSWIHLSVSQKYWCTTDSYLMTFSDQADIFTLKWQLVLSKLSFIISL